MDIKTQRLLAKKFSKRFEEYNTKVLEELADVISKFKDLTPSQARKLAQQLKYDKSYVDMIDELSKLTGQSKKELKKLLDKVAEQNVEFADVYFKARKMKTPVYEDTPELTTIVNNVVDMSGGDFSNIAKSTGFRLMDAKLVDDKIVKVPLDLNIKDTYYKVIDDCVYAIMQGKESYNTTMNKIIEQLAESGVRYIEYDNDGKHKYSQRIDTAVRRNVMDSIREASMKTNEELGKRFRFDGWEVTVHTEPAPDHMYVQGHQFRKEEFDKFQNDQDCVDVNGIKFPAESAETGRDRRNIGQYNCYHEAFPIVVGVDRPFYTQKELDDIIEQNNVEVEFEGNTYNKYELTQLQRKIETEIRKSKDKHIMYKKQDNKEKMLYYQKRITQLQNKYKEVTKLGGIRDRLIERSQVKGYRKIKEE